VVTTVEAVETQLPVLQPQERGDQESRLFMEKVEENRLNSRALLDQIRPEPVSLERLRQMDLLLEPHIPQVETNALSGDPLPLAFESSLAMKLNESDTADKRLSSFSFLLIQLLGLALMGMLTYLFLKIIKGLQGKGNDSSD
jgi:hypothetical protein